MGIPFSLLLFGSCSGLANAAATILFPFGQPILQTWLSSTQGILFLNSSSWALSISMASMSPLKSVAGSMSPKCPFPPQSTHLVASSGSARRQLLILTTGEHLRVSASLENPGEQAVQTPELSQVAQFRGQFSHTLGVAVESPQVSCLPWFGQAA